METTISFQVRGPVTDARTQLINAEIRQKEIDVAWERSVETTEAHAKLYAVIASHFENAVAVYGEDNLTVSYHGNCVTNGRGTYTMTATLNVWPTVATNVAPEHDED